MVNIGLDFPQKVFHSFPIAISTLIYEILDLSSMQQVFLHIKWLYCNYMKALTPCSENVSKNLFTKPGFLSSTSGASWLQNIHTVQSTSCFHYLCFQMQQSSLVSLEAALSLDWSRSQSNTGGSPQVCCPQRHLQDRAAPSASLPVPLWVVPGSPPLSPRLQGSVALLATWQISGSSASIVYSTKEYSCTPGHYVCSSPPSEGVWFDLSTVMSAHAWNQWGKSLSWRLFRRSQRSTSLLWPRLVK